MSEYYMYYAYIIIGACFLIGYVIVNHLMNIIARSKKGEEKKGGNWEKVFSNDNFDNHESSYAKLLGLSENPSPSEIKSKYRELIPKYHPDKVSHLGYEFKIIAEQKTKEINEAYSYYQKKFGFD